MFQVLGQSASPVKKVVLHSQSPDHIGQLMHRPLDDHPYSTKSHSLPTPMRKAGRPRKNKAGIIAIVPPADSALHLPTLCAGPQTPPPTASRTEHNHLRSQIPATPHSDLHLTTGSKRVAHEFITPQSSSRPHSFDFSLSSGKPWPSSSSPLTSPGGNGLGIFVNESAQYRHGVDPAMIYPDQKDLQDFNKCNTYTTLFRSPIQYPPYLGQRSLSNFEAMSSSAMYGSRERKRARTRTRSWAGEEHRSSRSSPTIASQPQTPISVICLAISETGQAVIEYKNIPATPESRSRVLSSSMSISTASSSTSTSMDDDPEADRVSEAETEIFDPKRDHLLHRDARVAMAKVLRRQQALVRRYREQMAITDPQQTDINEPRKKANRPHGHRNGKIKVTSGDVTSHEKLQAGQIMDSTAIPDRHFQLPPMVRSQEPLPAQQVKVEGEQRWRTDPLVNLPAHLPPQQQIFQPQAHELQVTHSSQTEEASKEPPKRKRGRPPKKQQQQYVQKDGGAITRCVCGQNDFVGAPMIQCDSCNHWLHMLCVNLDPRVRPIGAWYCPLCTSGIRAGA
ncbi:hypothetical protein V1509DRAFT_559529 [Lipomyces kononenkoae]